MPYLKMKKRTITIGLRNWQRLAQWKIRLALISYDAVLDRLFEAVENRGLAPESEHNRSP
jgi:hypothetical protein